MTETGFKFVRCKAKELETVLDGLVQEEEMKIYSVIPSGWTTNNKNEKRISNYDIIAYTSNIEEVTFDHVLYS